MTHKQFIKGFTLIELMIVVAIIGILAAVAIPKFANMLRKSREASTKGSLAGLRSALTIYISGNEGLIPGMYSDFSGAQIIIDVLTPKYIEGIPTSKLGIYHPDSGLIESSNVANRADLSFLNVDLNGWVYTTADGGSWWVNCTHTDTKNQVITFW